jgi:hypothetical protein
VTWAPEMAAPVESVTVPVIEAVSCAKRAAERQNTHAKTQSHKRPDFIGNS